MKFHRTGDDAVAGEKRRKTSANQKTAAARRIQFARQHSTAHQPSGVFEEPPAAIRKFGL